MKNIIKYYFKLENKTLVYKYIYQGDNIYLLTTLDDKPVVYIDVENFDFLFIDDEIDKLTEKEILLRIIDCYINE